MRASGVGLHGAVGVGPPAALDRGTWGMRGPSAAHEDRRGRDGLPPWNPRSGRPPQADERASVRSRFRAALSRCRATLNGPAVARTRLRVRPPGRHRQSSKTTRVVFIGGRFRTPETKAADSSPGPGHRPHRPYTRPRRPSLRRRYDPPIASAAGRVEPGPAGADAASPRACPDLSSKVRGYSTSGRAVQMKMRRAAPVSHVQAWAPLSPAGRMVMPCRPVVGGGEGPGVRVD